MNLSTIQKGCVLVTSHFTDEETETLENSASSLLSVSECQYCHLNLGLSDFKTPSALRQPRGDGMGRKMGWGYECTPVGDSCQCIVKTTTIL